MSLGCRHDATDADSALKDDIGPDGNTTSGLGSVLAIEFDAWRTSAIRRYIRRCVFRCVLEPRLHLLAKSDSRNVWVFSSSSKNDGLGPSVQVFGRRRRDI